MTDHLAQPFNRKGIKRPERLSDLKPKFQTHKRPLCKRLAKYSNASLYFKKQKVKYKAKRVTESKQAASKRTEK